MRLKNLLFSTTLIFLLDSCSKSSNTSQQSSKPKTDTISKPDKLINNKQNPQEHNKINSNPINTQGTTSTNESFKIILDPTNKGPFELFIDNYRRIIYKKSITKVDDGQVQQLFPKCTNCNLYKFEYKSDRDLEKKAILLFDKSTNSFKFIDSPTNISYDIKKINLVKEEKTSCKYIRKPVIVQKEMNGKSLSLCFGEAQNCLEAENKKIAQLYCLAESEDSCPSESSCANDPSIDVLGNEIK